MTREIRNIIGALLIGGLVTAAVSVSAFVYPDSAPPNYSVANPIYAPLNVGDDGQTKIGGLALCSGWDPNTVCIAAGGKIYAEGDLELETGVIKAINGVLQISATGGMRIPVMDSADMNALVSPADGTLIYTTDNDQLNIRLNGAWEQVTTN